jgi:mannose-6-phosphate isomerase-like protein (cupin superfamily)
MQHMTTTRAGVMPAGSGETLLEGPLGAVLVAGSEATGGSATFVIHPLAPRALGSLVHTHKHEDEWSFVLEGEVGVELDGEEFVARPGDLVMKPRGVPHAFWNAGDEPARLLEVITPGGFEGYFVRLAEILRPGAVPDMGALAALAAEYDLEVDPASIPRLAQAHGLVLAQM